ncbi:NAD(P)H-dependent oxidoreductase subunit E [Candidatus Woesearchaeota archaeon]|nr:NAD(P)H-dependent oxidoreductase subunit E [Candidatus Woesearchaeota archaeon]
MDIILDEFWKIQDKEGYVSEEAMKKLSKKTGIPIVKLYAAASFYSFIYTKPQGKYVIRLCNSPSCYLNGSLNIAEWIEKELGIRSGETTKDRLFSFHIGSCIGCCNEAPAMMINDKVYGNLTEQKVKGIFEKCRK